MSQLVNFTYLVDTLEDVDLLGALSLAKTPNLNWSIENPSVWRSFLQPIRNKCANIAVHINDTIVKVRKEVEGCGEGICILRPGGVCDSGLAWDGEQLSSCLFEGWR